MDGPDTQELRIATAMTGGVSLAIWMGGVAREINLLHQASRDRDAGVQHDQAAPGDQVSPDNQVRDLYRSLLDLLDVTVTVDVLSGTSAGGINAAVLGLAHARGLDLGPLRELWLTTGAFDTLLRDPASAGPRSLLQGDSVLLAKLQEGLETLANTEYVAGPADGEAPDTTVYVTTTLLTGETSRFTDDYGTLIPDVDHHGLFTFETAQLVSRDRDCIASLALAARSSASFPAAFEPAFLPFSRPHHGPVQPGELDMKDFANITRPQWAADGGLLMNRPIAPLLERIFERPVETSREVRRVLLYVVPSPGPANQGADPEVADRDAPLSLPEALIKDFDAILGQSISADLAAIRRHNDRVGAMRNTRVHLARLGTALRGKPPAGKLGERLATKELLDDYRTRQGESIAREVVGELLRAVASLDSDDVPDLWKQALGPAANGDQRHAEHRNAEQRCRETVAKRVADDWARLPDEDHVAEVARFGRPAYDAAKAIVLDLLHSAFVLTDEKQQREELARRVTEAHEIVELQQPRLRELAQEAVVAATTAPKPLEATASDLACDYVNGRATPEHGVKSLDDAWKKLAQVVKDAWPTLDALPKPASAGSATDDDRHLLRAPTLKERRRRAAERLHAYLEYLGPEPPGDDVAQLRIFDLYLAERAMLPVETVTEQAVELVQVSANTRTALAPQRATAHEKLTGVQLHHFGAFYKSSWRANDWMWGRLDGAGWLVHLLLDPRRVHTVTQQRDRGNGTKASDWFYEQLKQRSGGQDPYYEVVGADGKSVVVDEDAIKQELAFLDDGPDVELPASLPRTSVWVAQAVQCWIVAAELPVVAREMLVNPSRGASTWPQEVLRRADDMTAATEIARAAAAKPDGGATEAADLLAEIVPQRLASQIAQELGHRVGGGSALAAMMRPLATWSRRRTSLKLARTIMKEPELARVLTRSPAATTDVASDLARRIGARLAGPGRGRLRKVGQEEAAGVVKEFKEQPDRSMPGSTDRMATLLAGQLASCPVPSEKLPEEVGTPLFAKTVTKAVAVATAAATNVDRPPALLKPVMASARTVTLTGYRATAATGGKARRLIAIGSVLLAAGIILAIQHAVVLGLPGVVLAVSGAYLVVFGAWGVNPRAGKALLAVAVLVLLALPWLPFVRDWIFGSIGCEQAKVSCQGYVARRVVPWLRDQQFPLLVPGIFLVIVAAAHGWWGYHLGRRRWA